MKPKIICHIMSSVGGRLIDRRWTAPYEAERSELLKSYAAIGRELNTDAWMFEKNTVRAVFPEKFETNGGVVAPDTPTVFRVFLPSSNMWAAQPTVRRKDSTCSCSRLNKGNTRLYGSDMNFIRTNRSMRMNLLILFLFGASISLIACTSSAEERQKPTKQQPPNKPDDSNEGDGQPAPVCGHLTTENTVKDVIEHEAFAGFGQFILPAERRYDDNMPLSNVANLLPYHNYITGERAVETINTMIDSVHEGNRLFHDIYSAVGQLGGSTHGGLSRLLWATRIYQRDT